MCQVLHGSATTTEAIRRAIQHSQASLRQLAKRYGINPKTVAKWKARPSTADQRPGPREPRSTTLWAEEEAVVIGQLEAPQPQVAAIPATGRDDTRRVIRNG